VGVLGEALREQVGEARRELVSRSPPLEGKLSLSELKLEVVAGLWFSESGETSGM
jgi:hypothetical protein